MGDRQMSGPKAVRRTAQLRAWLLKPVDVPWRGLVSLSVALAALACIVIGIWAIYAPAGLIATGLALFLALTFDPSSARKVTWPR